MPLGQTTGTQLSFLCLLHIFLVRSCLIDLEANFRPIANIFLYLFSLLFMVSIFNIKKFFISE